MADDLVDPAPLRDEITKKINELFEMNQRVVSVLKAQASDFEMIGSFFMDQGNRAFEIASMITELSVVASHNTSNIIMAQFGHDDETELIDLRLSGDDDNDDDGGDSLLS